MGLVNKLQQICTQMGDIAGAGGMLVDKLSSIVVVGGQVCVLLCSRCGLALSPASERACV